MKCFQPPKSWLKLAPGTIEAWLVSDDPREQRLADEALSQLGADAARAYLQSLLVSEHDTRLHRLRLAGKVFLLPYAMLMVAYFVTAALELSLIGTGWILIATFGSLHVRQMTTILQTRIIHWVLARNDVQYIAILLKSFSTVPSVAVNTTVRERLPRLLRQVTVGTKNLIPDEYWAQFTRMLAGIARQKIILYVTVDQNLALAHIEICGNVRHEPALPALRTLATRDATTPQARELRELAAHYVAQWNVQPVNGMVQWRRV